MTDEHDCRRFLPWYDLDHSRTGLPPGTRRVCPRCKAVHETDGVVWVRVTVWKTFVDWLLGPKCHDCGQRVYPADRDGHQALEHAGD